MKNISNNMITPNQFMFMLIGSMIAAGILSLPNDVVEYAKQDGWISVFIGVLYPLYVIVMAGLIQKKFPNQNILFVNKKCFGKIIGTVFNTFLLLFFLLYLTAEITGLTNINRTVIMNFLSPMKIYIVITFLGAYSVYSGLKVLGRINETIFFLTLLMSLLFVVGIIKGSYLNVLPVFGSGMTNIAKSSVKSSYQYAGMEIYLLIYPYVLGNGNKQKLAFKAAFITALIYSWLTFVTIYSLGVNLIPKCLVSVPFVLKFLEIPVVNNFRFVFMSLWSLIVINLISNYYYGVITSLNSLLPKIDAKKICIIIYPFIVILCTKYINGTIRQDFLSFIIPKITISMLVYILIIVLFIYIRKEEYLE
jgi:spore germination protein